MRGAKEYLDIIGVPVLITDDGVTYIVCNKNFPKACGSCIVRFKCYTKAEKWETLEQYQTRWRK